MIDRCEIRADRRRPLAAAVHATGECASGCDLLLLETGRGLYGAPRAADSGGKTAWCGAGSLEAAVHYRDLEHLGVEDFQRQLKGRLAHAAIHLVGTVTAGSIVEYIELVANRHHRGHADAFMAPRAIGAVQHNGFAGGIPVVDVVGPIDPDRVRAQIADMIHKQKPGIAGRFKVHRRVLEIFRNGQGWCGVKRPLAMEILGAGDGDRPSYFCIRSTEEHHIFATLFDDMTGIGGHGIIGACLCGEGDGIVTLCPGTRRRRAGGVQRQVGGDGNLVSASSGVGGA